MSKNSFISLFFRYEKETSYGIDITYTNSNNKSNSISKIIEKTSFIYLNSEFLLYVMMIKELYLLILKI